MDILARIKEAGLLFDGAFGSLLMLRGLPEGILPELWCLEHPKVVTGIHADYVAAGADVLTTNTFGTSPLKLQKAGLEKRAAEINRRMVAMARVAAKPTTLIAGNIGPTGEMLAPFGKLSIEEATANYAEQARFLDAAGVDLFIIETMFDLNEALAALKGIQQVSAKPIFATMTFVESPTGFVTIMGNSVEESMHQLIEAGATAFGANCSIGSEKMVSLAQIIRSAVSVPVVIQPNAGIPILQNGLLHYPEDVAFYTRNIVTIKEAGVEIVGGCCGTTPEYIRAIRQALT
ncbi:MAG TPA: homocysteine S-methyltransferase family protein [Candidatus Marinimicrobia bacterium]|nr:homocysteine S-methyltransferase family protein [Candidatus Neomarinimicrobiota bacterium]HRS52398.1 homocysteine S-methyltransferase family protein [Candidatus Neomarinimicrobiota bacterium]